MKDVYILGAGKFAEEVGDVISLLDSLNLKGYIEGIDIKKAGTFIGGLPVIWLDDVTGIQEEFFSICGAGSQKRGIFIKSALEKGVKFINVIHPNAQMSKTVKTGKGVFINSGSVIAAQSVLGDHVLVNRGSLIGHHTVIEDHVIISPGANVAGRVHVKKGAFIGMGSIVIDGLTIGENSIVGSGAVVIRDVPDNVIVLGIPAKVVKSLQTE